MSLERLLHRSRLRLRSLLFRSRVEDELSDEIQDHLDCRTEELIARGYSREDARLAALRAFGGVDARKEECRDARHVALVDDAVRDVRYALRLMRRTPVFALVAVLSLAVGIGSTTAIFSLFDALLLKPLPVERPDELRVVYSELRIGGRSAKWGVPMPYQRYRQLAEAPDVFSDVVGFAVLGEATIQLPDRGSTAATGLFVSNDYFAVLGVGAALGRTFHASNATDGLHAVVLGHSFWRRHLGASPEAIGKTLSINGVPFTVIGVARQGFFGLTMGQTPDIYLPLDAMSAAQPSLLSLHDRRFWQVQAVGRLLPGVSEALAGSRLTDRWKLEEGAKAGSPELVVSVRPVETGLSSLRARFAGPLSVLMTMVSLLLLVACANVAGMLLSRAAARRGEIAMRMAIGARRGRLLRQLVTESALIAALAGVIGVGAASWMTRALLALMPSDSIGTLELSLDGRVLAFAVAVSVCAALVAGIAPAVFTVRSDIAAMGREARGATPHEGWLGRAFVVAQVALSLTLIVAAGLLARTLYRLSTLDPGFTVDRVVAVQVEPGAREYTNARLTQYYSELTERLRATPGVSDVTVAQFGFLSGSGTTGAIDVPGYSPATDEDRLLRVYLVGADFFKTLGVTILAGRDFTDRDLTGPVVALNESAARRFFGAASPIGRTVMSGKRTLEIIAVVRDAREDALRKDPVPTYFVPYTGALRARMTFIARVASEDDGLAAVVDRIRAADSTVPMTATTVSALYAKQIGQERLLSVLTGGFALTAVFLLALGVYGVLAFWVAQRTPEIGVRLALGSTRGAVMWSVLQQPLRFVMLGSALGLAATLAGGTFISSLLFDLKPHDPATLAAAVATMAAVGMFAGVIPARRASRVDPVAALRCE
jgi:predicted permease